MRKNYILIDYENKAIKDISALSAEHFHVIILLGSRQTNLAVDLVLEMQKMGERGRYIQISGQAKNELDFHLVLHLGELIAKEPDACFHIVSSDKDFDPVIAHLRSRKISANRVESLDNIPLLRVAALSTTPERVDAAGGRLSAANHSRPKTLKTLRSSLHSFFQKKLSDAELDEIIAGLKRRKALTIAADGKVVYPDSAAAKKPTTPAKPAANQPAKQPPPAKTLAAATA